MFCQPCTDHGLKGVSIETYRFLDIETYVIAGSNFLDISIDLILGKSRERNIKDCRHMLMTYLRHYPKYKCVEIAKYFLKDHTTVVHAANAVYSLCFSEPDYKKRYLELVNHLNLLR